MDFVSKRNLLLMFAAIGCLLTPALVFATKFPVWFGVAIALVGVLIMTVIWTAVCMALLLPISVIEWRLFKRYYFFKEWDDAWRTNLASLMWTIVYLWIFIAVFVFLSVVPSYNAFMERESSTIIPISISLAFAIIFLVMKLRRMRNITKESTMKKQLILFNVILSTMFGLIIFLLLMRRFQ